MDGAAAAVGIIWQKTARTCRIKLSANKGLRAGPKYVIGGRPHVLGGRSTMSSYFASGVSSEGSRIMRVYLFLPGIYLSSVCAFVYLLSVCGCGFISFSDIAYLFYLCNYMFMSILFLIMRDYIVFIHLCIYLFSHTCLFISRFLDLCVYLQILWSCGKGKD